MGAPDKQFRRQKINHESQPFLERKTCLKILYLLCVVDPLSCQKATLNGTAYTFDALTYLEITAENIYNKHVILRNSWSWLSDFSDKGDGIFLYKKLFKYKSIGIQVIPIVTEGESQTRSATLIAHK